MQHARKWARMGLTSAFPVEYELMIEDSSGLDTNSLVPSWFVGRVGAEK